MDEDKYMEVRNRIIQICENQLNQMNQTLAKVHDRLTDVEGTIKAKKDEIKDLERAIGIQQNIIQANSQAEVYQNDSIRADWIKFLPEEERLVHSIKESLQQYETELTELNTRKNAMEKDQQRILDMIEIFEKRNKHIPFGIRPDEMIPDKESMATRK
jgi:chromosome segregation ATPase